MFFVVVHVVHFDFFGWMVWAAMSCAMQGHVSPDSCLNHWRRLLGSMDSEQMITTSLLATHIWRPSIFDGWALRLLVVHSVATVMVPPTAKTRWVCVWAEIPEISVWMSSYCNMRRTPPLQMSLMILECIIIMKRWIFFFSLVHFPNRTWSTRPCLLYHWLLYTFIHLSWLHFPKGTKF